METTITPPNQHWPLGAPTVVHVAGHFSSWTGNFLMAPFGARLLVVAPLACGVLSLCISVMQPCQAATTPEPVPAPAVTLASMPDHLILRCLTPLSLESR